MTLSKHIDAIVKSGFYNLHNIAKIRQYLSFDTAKTYLVVALVLYRKQTIVTHCFFFGMVHLSIWLPRLQNVQNVAARIIVRLGKNDLITLVLKGLHWLLVDLRIVYNINLLTFKYINEQPLSIYKTMDVGKPYRLRFLTDGIRLNLPLYGSGLRSFSVCGPELWNELPSARYR